MKVETKREEPRVSYKPGLTSRSLTAIAVAVFFLMPITIYSMLLGAGGLSAVPWIAVLLFTEIYRFIRKPLSTQEITIMWYAIGIGSAGSIFLVLLQQGYIATSPITGMFSDPYTGKSLRALIPSWFAPPWGSETYLLRTFIDATWATPILIFILNSVFSLFMQVSLAMIFSQMYVETEKLTFPFAPIEATICKTLGEKGEFRMGILMLSAFFGCFWGYLLYGIPIITTGVYKTPLQIIPIPYVDLNRYIEQWLPGASFGIATDIVAYTWGFFLPANIVICMFIGSFAAWVLGNYIALTIPYFSQWQKEWTPGMSISLIYQRSTLWVWINFQIGAAIAAGVAPLIMYRRTIFRSFKSLMRISSSSLEAGYLSLKVLFPVYIISAFGIVAIFHYLVPDFPLWIVVPLTIGYPFFIAMMAGRMVGEVGFPISIPYIWQGAILISNYPKVDAWFFSPLSTNAWYAGLGSAGTSGDGAAINVYQIKVCQLTGTRPMDLFKALIFVFPLSIVASFIYVSLFWWMSPIPSAAYPATTISWPIAAINFGLWATRQLNIFKPELIFGSMTAMTAITIAFHLLHIPFSLTGIVIGLYTLPPYSLAWLIGFIIGHCVLRRKLGDRWEEIKPVIVGGVTLGEGVAIGLSVILVIIAKSLWILPY